MKKNWINFAIGISIGLGGFSQLAYTQAPVTINPFDGAVGYVNPDYVKEVNDFFIEHDKDGTYKNKANALGLLDGGNWNISTGIWLDSRKAITGEPPRSREMSLYLDNPDGTGALQKANAIGKPVVVTYVIYDLPVRDCDAYSSNGEFKTPEEIGLYKTTYIDPIVAIFQKFYSNPENAKKVRVALVIEPDSLPNLITNISNPPPSKCSQALEPYTQGISYALEKFSTIPTISMYLDIAHSGWLGWESNINKIPNFYNNSDAPAGLGKGFDAVRGFITNTSNYTPFKEAFTREEYFNYANLIQASDFYSWNKAFDETSFIAEIVGLNKYQGKYFLTDTSRNGWIPNSEDYIGYNKDEKSKVGAKYTRLDQRHHRGNWCNVQSVLPQSDYVYRPSSQKEKAIPSRPTSPGFGNQPAPNPSVVYAGNSLPVDAFVWIKPPGEGDGSYDPSTGAGDQMCGALSYVAQNNSKSGGGSHNDYQLTDSLQDGGKPAPHAGKFFPAAFKNLIDSSICSKGIKGFTSPFCSSPDASSKSKK